jgi:hypothetical protein
MPYSLTAGSNKCARLVRLMSLMACLLSPFAAILSLPAQTAPTIVSVSPADGATQVPTTSPLTFVFDQAMDTSVVIVQSMAGFTGNLELTAPGFNQFVTGTWGDDEKTLTITPTAQFPYATFSWKLNPPGVSSF